MAGADGMNVIAMMLAEGESVLLTPPPSEVVAIPRAEWNSVTVCRPPTRDASSAEVSRPGPCLGPCPGPYPGHCPGSLSWIRVTSRRVTWLRPFLNEDPCGVFAAASLPNEVHACSWLCS